MSDTNPRKMDPTSCPLDVLIMGSLFIELVPEGPGQALLEMKCLIPTAAGAAANVARALAALGSRVGMLTRIGPDELGEWLRRELTEAGIDTEAVMTAPGRLTPISFASADLRGGKQFLFYRFPGYSDPMADLSPTSIDRTTIGRARLFDFTEAVIRQPGVREAAFHAARLCREAGGKVVYAVNYRPQAWRLPPADIAAAQREAIALADVAVMNEEEYQLIFGNEEPRAVLSAGPTIVVTAGERGGWVQQTTAREYFPARSVQVQYDVGAGDSFHAAYVAAYLEGQPPARAARFAAACAALKISRPITAPLPTRQEVIDFMA
jgi:5-dehydro-2-deoxygluconokinase